MIDSFVMIALDEFFIPSSDGAFQNVSGEAFSLGRRL